MPKCLLYKVFLLVQGVCQIRKGKVANPPWQSRWPLYLVTVTRWDPGVPHLPVAARDSPLFATVVACRSTDNTGMTTAETEPAGLDPQVLADLFAKRKPALAQRGVA